jgi:hypothetical protein
VLGSLTKASAIEMPRLRRRKSASVPSKDVRLPLQHTFVPPYYYSVVGLHSIVTAFFVVTGVLHDVDASEDQPDELHICGSASKL